MRADDTMAHAARALLERRRAELDARLRAVHRGREDAVHDARTWVRRLRAEIDALSGNVISTRRARPVEHLLHDLERVLAESRDAQSMLEHVRAFRADHRLARADLRSLERRLRARAHAAEEAAREALTRGRRARYVDALRSLAEHVRPERDDPRALVGHFAHEMVWRRYDELRAHGSEPIDPESTHRFRVSARRMRHVVEMLGEALPLAAQWIVPLRRAQDESGALHDHHVGITRLEKWLRKGKLRSSPGLTAYLASLRHARDAALAQRSKREALLRPAFRARITRGLAVATER